MVQKKVEVNSAVKEEYFCVATFLPLRSWLNVVPFLRLTAGIEKQLKGTRGVVRYGLKADILHKRFWTISVWWDKESMREFVTDEPHLTAIRNFESWAGDGAAFVEYASRTGVINWSEAELKLQKPSFYYYKRKNVS